MNKQGQKNKQKTDLNSIINLSEIGTSLSDFEEVENKSCKKNYTLLGRSTSYYEEKMKSKKNNKYYLIKKERPEYVQYKDYIRETKINSQLQHENIIRLYGNFEDYEKFPKISEIYYETKRDYEDKKIYCLVYELIENDDLDCYLWKHREKYKENDYIPIEEDFIIKILTQTLRALNYMQSQSVIHRDLSLDNIQLDENNNVKIKNFRLSALMKDNNPINKNKDLDLFCNYSYVGKINFVCPEIYNKQKYDYKADIFSLGKSMLCLMSKNTNIPIKQQQIENIDENYCKELKDLVKEMIIDNPEERINSRKAYSKILQIKNAIISHSPNFNPIKYLNNIGVKLSDFGEIKNNQKNYFILGAGNFSYTEKMKSKKNNKIYAIKKLSTQISIKEKKNFIRETEISTDLNHKNILKFYGYFKDKEKKDKYKEIYEEINKKSNKKINLDNIFEDKEIFCLVMEYAKNGSLESYYEDYKNRFKDKEHFLPLNEKLIIKIFKQLLNGVNYLHSKGVIHGNIKTNNILLDEKNNIKISFFDISALFKGNNGDKDEDKKKDEIKKFEKYDSKVDIYKIGLAMLYIMSFENPIIKDDKNNEFVDKKAINECYNIYLKKLVLRMLNKDKNLRPNGKEILDEIALIEFYQNNPTNLLIKNFLDERNEPKIKEIKKSKNVQINNINNQNNYNHSLNNSPNNNNNFQNHYTFNNNQNINNGLNQNNQYESHNQFATQQINNYTMNMVFPNNQSMNNFQ